MALEGVLTVMLLLIMGAAVTPALGRVAAAGGEPCLRPGSRRMQSHCGALAHPSQRDADSGHVALVESILHRQAARPLGGVPMISDRPSGWAPRATRRQAGLSTDQPSRAASRRSD